MTDRRPLTLRADTTPPRLEEMPAGDALPADTLGNALQVLLQGLITSNSAGITTSDTVLQALGKLQAQSNVPIDLTLGAASANSRIISISKGASVTLPAATSSTAGLMTAAESVKLGTVATNASANSSDAFLLNRANHSGTQPLSTITGTGTAAAMNVLGAGGIIERGSNANGEYVCFADGTMICIHKITGISPANPTSVANIFRSNSIIWTFPAVFTSPPSVSHGESSGIGLCWTSLGTSLITTTTTSFALYSMTQAGSATVCITAIGRWK